MFVAVCHDRLSVDVIAMHMIHGGILDIIWPPGFIVDVTPIQSKSLLVGDRVVPSSRIVRMQRITFYYQSLVGSNVTDLRARPPREFFRKYGADTR
jgi:hypothetical protein